MAKFSIMLFGIDSYTKNKMQLYRTSWTQKAQMQHSVRHGCAQ